MVTLSVIKPYEDNKGNRIIFEGSPIEQNVSVIFRGSRNTLRIDKNARIRKLSVRFDQDNGICEIGGNDATVSYYQGHIRVGIDSHVLIGKNVSATNPMQISAVEGTTISIGDDVMVAGSVKIRGDDGHPIFDVRTGKRINFAQDIKIGNHVWLGLESIIFGGAEIGDGSVVGARSVVTKKFPNNVIVAGQPAKIIRRNIAWERPHLSMTSPAYKQTGLDVSKSEDYWNITTDL